jgi:hypothetical protein
MNTFNNFSPLAFREKSQKATYKKWYAYGKEFALPFSTTELPPFQFTVANLPSFDPTTVEVFLVNEATGVRTGTGIKIKVDTMNEHNSVLYVSPGSNVYAKSMEPGVYRAEFAIPEGETYVSTPICITEGIETNTNFVKLEYWNDEKLAYPNGFVTTGTDNDFKFQMYIPTTFFKPKYEFEEEITKRAGYKFLELQTCNKVFGFNFLAPEYICDALRLVRLSDYIRFTHDGEYYNALNFEYNPDWQDNGYLAAIECQFETDTIIQKLPSFNRRDRESFYNALLADIDTPILFSPDVVGLYYREYKQGEPTIKGKLIRELSPIDLIDENTTIAVDMGAGEARKFNLYRMLEGYISKNHEDVTEFLLSLRGGVNIGTPNTSGEYPASVDRDGNAKLKDVQGKDATFKTVETGFLTVNKTSATIDGMGNANVNDLTARGDSMLRSDVYTGSKNGSPTGKITKEGQLQYLSAIIYEFLSSETFVPGFLGEGFKIWLENGNWHIECDNLTVRQTMNIFELLIQKIRSVNGAIVVSQSNGKVTAVEDTGTQYKITFGEEFPTFQEGDLIRCQSWSKNNLKFYWVEVKTAADGYILCDKSEFNNVVPAVGDEVVQMGNTKNPERQALIYITAQESGHPYIEILNGVKTKSLSGTNRTRLGDLSNIQDSAFPEGQQPSGSGLYCDNAFLRGIFLLRNGKSVEDEVNQAKQDAANAATEAERAQQTAQEAKDRLNKWADDGFISPTEKPALIDEGKRIQAEYLQIKANADKYGVLVAEYTEAYNNYLNELRYHSAETPEDIAVRPELAQTQTTYYDKRNGALNAIADAAKSYVDEADKKLKEYLDTEITAIPGKIELAVRSLKTADTNLLKGAFREITNASYNIGYYNYDVPVINGKEYTLTVCYTLSSENKRISAYSNRGTNFLVDFNTKGNMVVESKKVTMVNYKPTEGLYFFQFPQGIYGSKVHWAVLTDGNLGVTSWIPAASEKNVGLKNLCSFKRITDAGFTYLSNYKDDGRFYVDPGLLHIQTNVADKDMFGLTYDPSKQYYIFIDKAFRSDTEDKASVLFLVKYTDGTQDLICSVYPSEVQYNHFISQKPISKIVGSYEFGYGTTVRVGVYETNFLVSWSPAPEDQLYQSVKYTDTQILAIDGKIELSVKTKVENLGIGANNLYSYTSSTLNTLYPSPIIERQMSLHGFYLVGSQGKRGAMRIPNIIPPIPGKYTVSGWIKGSQNTPVGFTIDVCDSENVIVKSTADNQWSYFKHTFNVTKNTEEQKDVYNFVDIAEISWAYIWVKDFKVEAGEIATAWSPNEADSVYFSKEYTRSQIDIVEGKITSTVEKVDVVDGKVTGLSSRVTQTESSINSVVERVDDQGNRLNAAEIKLDSTSVKLGVVEGTANDAKSTASSASSAASSAQSTANAAESAAGAAQSTANAAKSAAGAAQSTANAANSLAGTANNKADATNNGLVETGINITSRKIVLKSDNVLFQNNAGQQTAAINANGKLTANAIEVGEVVANGFVAQRITTGNLTVTDGAVIAGMTISGGRLTGSNMTLTEGAKIGKFEVTSLGLLFGKSDTFIDLWAGSDTTGGRSSRLGAGTIKIDNNSASLDSLTITGAGNVNVAGTTEIHNVNRFKLKTKNYHGPGVWCYGKCLNGTLTELYKCNDNIQVTCVRTTKGYYRFTLGGEITGFFCPIAIPRTDSTGGFKWINAAISNQGSRDFTVFLYDVNEGAKDGNFYFAVLANPTV